MKYILFVGENAAGTDDKKCAKQFKRKNSRKADVAKNLFYHTKPGKKGPVSDCSKATKSR